jgi:excinuclease ABC subunit C
MSKKLQVIIQNLPQKPGVYIFKDIKGRALYVGKAGKLRARVNSYFTRSGELSADKKIMFSKISQIDHIITSSETEALLLESNLIKKYKPQYNVILKDDKQYKYIKIDYTDDFPKIYTVRRIEKGPASYYGPYTDAYAVKQTLNLLNKLFPYRECNQKIFIDNPEELRQKVCLRYHIKRCLSPCAGKISKDDYNNLIRQCELFLQGNQEKILTDIKFKMESAAKARDFEKAAFFRDQIRNLKEIIAEQKVISTKKLDQDIISYYITPSISPFKKGGLKGDFRASIVVINLFMVREGKLAGKENFRLETPKDLTISEILSSFVKQYYSTQRFLPDELIIQNEIDDRETILAWLSKKRSKKVKILVPKRGRTRKLINLGIENTKEYLKVFIPSPHPLPQRERGTLAELAKIFKLPTVPKRIECFDISNIQGQAATGSMVVFENGEPKKSEYRRFRIRFKKISDVEMLKEMLSRRFKNSLAFQDVRPADRWILPNLIIIDGGKPQLNTALSVLSEFNLKIPVLTLAKKFEEIYSPSLTKPKRLPSDSKVLYLLQRIRDEAHRFAISYHKKLKEKELSRSFLDEISGIGEKRKKLLLEKFKTPEAIRGATFDELKGVVGGKVAKRIIFYRPLGQVRKL